jgi:ABC-type Fe3+ transport system permease subunit
VEHAADRRLGLHRLRRAGAAGGLRGDALSLPLGCRLPAPADFLPYLVPGIALPPPFFRCLPVASGPVPALYGTPLILILALIAEKMPYASRSGIAAMTQLGKEAEEAARIAGAGWFARIRRIVIPIQAAPLATGICCRLSQELKASACL